MPLTAIASLLTPALCLACGAACPSEELLCRRCGAEFRRCLPIADRPPPGVDRVFSACPHEGVARDVLGALKFRGMTSAAALIAGRMAALAPPGLIAGTLVAVPAAPLRARWRGYDPAAEIAIALSGLSGLPLCDCLERRDLRRQRGRGRVERIVRPPRIGLIHHPPAEALLVDDVLTTGTTLAACARALREGGAQGVAAVTFARRL